MRSKLLFLMVLLAVVMFAGGVQANMFTNASFEDGTFPGDYPDYWTGWDPGGTHEWIDSSTAHGLAHNGDKMIMMDGTGGRCMVFNSNDVDVLVEYGRTYYVGFWGKAGDGETSATTSLKLEWHMFPNEPDQGTALVENLTGFDVGTEWIRFVNETTAPDASHLYYRYVFNHEPGFVPYLIDDLHFDKYSEEDLAYPVKNPDPSDEAEGVPPSTTVLSWETVIFEDRYPKVEAYWGTQDDPNFWGFTGGGGEPKQISYLADPNLTNHSIDLSTIPAPLGGPISLAPTEIYYWALKYEDPNVNVAEQVAYWGNPVLLKGPTWSFDTINKPPVVDAGPHTTKWMAAGDPPVKVGLDASYSDDGLPENGNLTYTWTSDPCSNITFAPSNACQDPNVTISAAGDYLLTLVMHDDEGGVQDETGDDNVLIRIIANADDRLRAHYKLDETVGFVASDSDNSDPCDTHPGTLEDNPVWQPAGGQVAGAIELDGTDDDIVADGKGDYVSIDDTGSDPNWEPDTWENSGLIDGMTVSAWMNLADGWSKGWEGLVGKSNYSWELLRDVSNSGVAFSVQGGIGNAISSADADVTSGWHQVAGVYNRNEVSIYVDGLLEGSVAAGTINLETNPQNTQDWQIQKAAGKISIGQTNNLDFPDNDYSFEGLIDQVRIFDAAVPWRADYSGTPGIVELYRADTGHESCGNDHIESDLNGDCYVDLGDFALVALTWMECSDAANADCD